MGCSAQFKQFHLKEPVIACSIFISWNIKIEVKNIFFNFVFTKYHICENCFIKNFMKLYYKRLIIMFLINSGKSMIKVIKS